MPDFALSTGRAEKIPGTDLTLPNDPWSVPWIVDVATNFTLLYGGTRILAPGRLFSTSFKLNPNIPKVIKWTVLPFTVTAVEPGLLHFAFDLALYKGSHAFFEWVKGMNQIDILNLIRTGDIWSYQQVKDAAAAHPDWFPQGSSVVAEVTYPPMWLADP